MEYEGEEEKKSSEGRSWRQYFFSSLPTRLPQVGHWPMRQGFSGASIGLGYIWPTCGASWFAFWLQLFFFLPWFPLKSQGIYSLTEFERSFFFLCRYEKVFSPSNVSLHRQPSHFAPPRRKKCAPPSTHGSPPATHDTGLFGVLVTDSDSDYDSCCRHDVTLYENLLFSNLVNSIVLPMLWDMWQTQYWSSISQSEIKTNSKRNYMQWCMFETLSTHTSTALCNIEVEYQFQKVPRQPSGTCLRSLPLKKRIDYPAV